MSSPRDIEMINQNTDAEVAKVTALLGATGDTGGSATAGSIMAKLNAIFTNASNAAGYANSAKANTTTNNTASKTGILSQKLAYAIGLLENTTYGLSALKTAVTGGSAIAKVFKSWNSYTYYNKANVNDTSFKISTVNPARCIVLVERLTDVNNRTYTYDYTLTANSIEITHSAYTVDNYIGLIFTVLELY